MIHLVMFGIGVAAVVLISAIMITRHIMKPSFRSVLIEETAKRGGQAPTTLVAYENLCKQVATAAKKYRAGMKSRGCNYLLFDVELKGVKLTNSYPTIIIGSEVALANCEALLEALRGEDESSDD